MPDAAGTRVTPKLRVLFLCTGNSCRSQMAEGWARQLKGEVIDASSAGTHPKALTRWQSRSWLTWESTSRPSSQIPGCRRTPPLRLRGDRL